MEWVAVDVETACSDPTSICEIGLVRYHGRDVVEEWSTLVDPEVELDPWNQSIHGITSKDLVGAPTIDELRRDLWQYFDGRVAVSHTAFDRNAINGSLEARGFRRSSTEWLDSAMVARRAWPRLQRYGLADLARELGYPLRHHRALADARACGWLVCRAMEATGLDIAGWQKRVQRPIGSAKPKPSREVVREGGTDGPLSGEIVVFTGSLGLDRRRAADRVASAGAKVAKGVTQKTTLLVVGDQDLRQLGGKAKSSKHSKAEALRAKGFPLRIIGESELESLLS